MKLGPAADSLLPGGVNPPPVIVAGARRRGTGPAGLRDAGLRDAGLRDAGLRDAGLRDARLRDARDRGRLPDRNRLN